MEAARACLAYSMVELLRTGTTTVTEIGSDREDAVRQAAASVCASTWD
jgi:hypothetical protein